MRRHLALAALGAALMTPVAWAQQQSPLAVPVSMDKAIVGTMDIDFGTRTNKLADGRTKPGTHDVYKTDLTIAGSVRLVGEVRRQPWIPNPSLGTTQQAGFMEYKLGWELINEKNPAQKVTLGGWNGGLTTDGEGVYHLTQAPAGMGDLRIAISPVGNIPGFTSNFEGKMVGKKPQQSGLKGAWSSSVEKTQRTYVRYLGDGQAVRHVVKGADPVGFQNVKLAKGPIAGYPEAVVSGSMDYDGEAGNWYADFRVTYFIDGRNMSDRYSGTVRWIEDPKRTQNGLGRYEYNIRINEKEPSAGDVFKQATAAATEDAFFAADNKVPGLIGTVTYKDKFGGADGKTVTSSNIVWAVSAVDMSKIQLLNFVKVSKLMEGPLSDE